MTRTSLVVPRTLRTNVLCLGLYSSRYPAIGESHGLSVVAGAIENKMDAATSTHIIDLVEQGTEDCSVASRFIAEHQVNVLAIGLSYGTYSVLKRELPSLIEQLPTRHLVIVGGPLATYLAEPILREISPEAIVIVGEADEAIAGTVEAWQDGVPFESVANLVYIDASG